MGGAQPLTLRHDKPGGGVNVMNEMCQGRLLQVTPLKENDAQSSERSYVVSGSGLAPLPASTPQQQGVVGIHLFI